MYYRQFLFPANLVWTENSAAHPSKFSLRSSHPLSTLIGSSSKEPLWEAASKVSPRRRGPRHLGRERVARSAWRWLPPMRIAREMPPPNQKVRRGCSCSLCGGLEGGEDVKLPGQGCRKQSAVGDEGNGNPPVDVYWVLPICLVYAVTGLVGFRLGWKAILGTDWFLVGQRTVKPQHLAAVGSRPHSPLGYQSGQGSVRTNRLWERLTQGTYTQASLFHHPCPL